MPIFEYECQKCGHQFEEIVVSSQTEILCRECSSPEVKKIPSLCSHPGLKPYTPPKKRFKPFQHNPETAHLGTSMLKPSEFKDRVTKDKGEP